jgi:hypothetical protein
MLAEAIEKEKETGKLQRENFRNAQLAGARQRWRRPKCRAI